jgi:hypothetical protein
MPMFFFLPFILATGMFSVASESLAPTRKSEPEKRGS